jgi:hypothetical protein
MQHDLRRRAAARAIYDACFPTDEVAPVGFDDAKRFGTIHYRRAVEAARSARLTMMFDTGRELPLFEGLSA